MGLLDIAIIVGISAIVNVFITWLLLQLILIKMNLKPYVRMAKQFASQMGLNSQKVQHDKRTKEMATAAKAKVTAAAIDTLPMGGILKQVLSKAQVTPDEIFALLQDPNFMKGVKVMIDTFGGIYQKITGAGKEPEKQIDSVPNFQYGQ
jgi:hypothetical protein